MRRRNGISSSSGGEGMLGPWAVSPPLLIVPTPLAVPRSHLAVPRAHLAVPGAHLADPRAHLDVPGAHLAVPRSHLAALSRSQSPGDCLGGVPEVLRHHRAGSALELILLSPEGLRVPPARPWS